MDQMSLILLAEIGFRGGSWKDILRHFLQVKKLQEDHEYALTLQKLYQL
jgi:hypothetical protein